MESHEGGIVDNREAARSEKRASMGAWLRDALPMVGVAAALIANAAWIGFLGYSIFRLI